MSKPNRLQAALARGLGPDGDLFEELSDLGDYEISSLADAESLVHALAEYSRRAVNPDETFSALAELTRLFQSVVSAEAFRYLALKGIPLLIDAYDARMVDPSEFQNDLLLALKIFARYGTEEGLNRVVDGAFSVALNDGYLWSVIFEQLKDIDPLIPSLIGRLSDPLPDRYACYAFLNWVNRLARKGVITSHPFNSAQGLDFLRGWLADRSDDFISYAHSATSAIPFIKDPPRSELLALAMDHRNIGVQLEAAWASARLGSEAGIKFLARQCLDRDLSIAARAYLTELRREDAIPDEANDPDFVAMARMCEWLAHPQEYGRPPDEIELYDSRELFWPPTNDWRPLWLFKFRYDASEGNDPSEGVGMSGSITFALFGETAANMPAEDIYSLHCCWELEANEDPRAPMERSIEVGRALIEAAQQDDLDDDEKF